MVQRVPLVGMESLVSQTIIPEIMRKMLQIGIEEVYERGEIFIRYTGNRGPTQILHLINFLENVGIFMLLIFIVMLDFCYSHLLLKT